MLPFDFEARQYPICASKFQQARQWPHRAKLMEFRAGIAFGARVRDLC
jgi:hypothetical protein